MPLRDARYDHIKVYRPRGSRFAHGRANATPAYGKYWIATGEVVAMAINGAMRAFETEFGRPPHVDFLVVEVVCSTTEVSACVIEITEPTEK